MRKLKKTLLYCLLFTLLFATKVKGFTISGYANYDYNTMVSIPMFEGGLAAHISDLSAGLRLFSYKAYPMLSRNDPLFTEINKTCYLYQYFLEYKLKPFKITFKHNFYRTNEIISKDDMPDFTYIRDAFPDFNVSAYYIYDGDINVLIGLGYNFNNQYMTELMIEKDFLRIFTFGAKNTTYMYLVEKSWSVSGSPICQLYEVYLKLKLSENIYFYFNDWCYHPVASESRKSAYYVANSHNPMGLSFGININLKK